MKAAVGEWAHPDIGISLTMGEERDAATLMPSSFSWSRPMRSACCST